MAPQGLVHGTPAKNVALASANGSERLHVLQHVAAPVFFTVAVSNRSGFAANVCRLLILFRAGSVELVGGGEGRGVEWGEWGGSSPLHCNCQLANQAFMETRRLIVLRCRGLGCEPRCCAPPLFERPD